MSRTVRVSRDFADLLKFAEWYLGCKSIVEASDMIFEKPELLIKVKEAYSKMKESRNV